MSKLTGKLFLSDIDKDAIEVDRKTGKKYIWVDVVERRSVGKYGETHYISMWHKGKTTYLADLKQWGTDRQPQPTTETGDMPNF